MNVQLVECPRDAMQGWKNFIETDDKVRYLEALLRVGFHTLDFGSFVSPKAIPQMADTKVVLRGIEHVYSSTHLLAIVANERGAEESIPFERIKYLGFPFSVSPTFQQRNTNSTQEESLQRIDFIQNLCLKNNKELVVYLSMGFGNPYGDPYSPEVLSQWTDVMVNKGIKIISLADTVGVASADAIKTAVETLVPAYPDTTIGVHLHSTSTNWREKLEAAYNAGCQRFDGALKGIGGCPMAQDDLVGNMDSLLMLDYFKEKNAIRHIDETLLPEAVKIANEIFS
jgi:hydroxymethylglutaryl-CoA lyase